MSKYIILGRSKAGSLIPEFLLTELGIDYDIEFPRRSDLIDPSNKGFNPLGRIPVLICPDRTRIFESIAIVNHITNQFQRLIPNVEAPEYTIYWQVLALLATTVYPAYHRQHHSPNYVEEVGIESLRVKAQEEQSVVFDYIECLLSPFVCGKEITAVDFYLYTLMRWDLNKTKLRKNRPNLTFFLNALRSRKSVDTVLDNQPKKK